MRRQAGTINAQRTPHHYERYLWNSEISELPAAAWRTTTFGHDAVNDAGKYGGLAKLGEKR